MIARDPNYVPDLADMETTLAVLSWMYEGLYPNDVVRAEIASVQRRLTETLNEVLAEL